MQMVLSKWIMLPLATLLGAVLLVSYVLGYPEYSYLLIPLIVLLAVTYVLHQDIDRWYVKKKPRKLPQGMLRFISDHMPFYALMDADQKVAFQHATSIFLKTATFMPQGFDKVPEDLKAVVAANAHMLSAFRPAWHQKFEAFETVVIYRHPFPSPQFNQHLHSSELYLEDKVVLFCADHFMKAFRFPEQFFNTAMYEWAKVLLLGQGADLHVDPNAFEAISGFANADIVAYIGLPEAYIHWDAVATTYFFTFPVRYSMYMEDSYPHMVAFYGVDPIVRFNAKS